MARLRLNEGELRRLVRGLVEGDVIQFPTPERKAEIIVKIKITEAEGRKLRDTVEYLRAAGNAMGERINGNPRERFSIVPQLPSKSVNALVARYQERGGGGEGDLVSVVASEERDEGAVGASTEVSTRTYYMSFTAVTREMEGAGSIAMTKDGERRGNRELLSAIATSSWGRINRMMMDAGYEPVPTRADIMNLGKPGYYEFSIIDNARKD